MKYKSCCQFQSGSEWGGQEAGVFPHWRPREAAPAPAETNGQVCGQHPRWRGGGARASHWSCQVRYQPMKGQGLKMTWWFQVPDGELWQGPEDYEDSGYHRHLLGAKRQSWRVRDGEQIQHKRGRPQQSVPGLEGHGVAEVEKNFIIKPSKK